MLHQGDALAILETLPTGSVDAVLTDPPYSSGGNTLATIQQEPAAKYQTTGTKKQYPPMLGDNKDQRSFLAWAILWLAQCWRITKDGGPIMLFTDWRQLPTMTDAMQGAGWLWLGIMPWNKRSCRPYPGRFRAQCEYVLFGSKGRFRSPTRACLPGLFDWPVIPQQKAHITGKPVGLIKDLLAITADGAIILDPFIGGGSTAIAALEMGRSCIGIELSPEYAKIAAERSAIFL
jgi:site-specific DNA-methyltransferase (adenine-specific)